MFRFSQSEFQNIMLSFIAGHLPSKVRVREGKEKEEEVAGSKSPSQIEK